MKCAEEQGFVEFVVARYGPTDTEATVDFKAIDISAKFGEDYYITVPKLFRDDKLEMPEDAQTIVEITANDANQSEVTLGETDSSITANDASESEVTLGENDSSVTANDANQSEVTLGENDSSNTETEESTSEESTSETVDEEVLEVETSNENSVSSSDSNVDSLADARTALLGVPTDTTSWQDTLSKEEVAEELLKQNQSYYDELPGATCTFTFKPGEYQKVLRFYLKDDSISESDEQVMFVLSNVSGSAIDANPTGYMNITDNEEVEKATYSFEESLVFAEDGNEYVTATLLRTAGIEQYSIVTLGTASLTAQPDVDYTAITQEITFVPGQTQQIIRIPINQRDRIEPLNFNLQVIDDETSDASVTVVLPANTEGGTAVYSSLTKASTNLLDPLSQSAFWKGSSVSVERMHRGHFDSCNLSYYGLEGSGTYKYRVYQLNGVAYAEQAGNWTEITAETTSLAGVEKIKYTIDDVKAGNMYDKGFWWKEILVDDCTDYFCILNGSDRTYLWYSEHIREPKQENIVYTLTDSDRKQKKLQFQARPRYHTNEAQVELSAELYVNPVEIILRNPNENDTDGTVRAYTWTGQDTKSSTYTSYKLGTLGFVGSNSSTTSKILYPDGDASGVVNFEAVYDETISQDIIDKTYLWGYKIEREAGQTDGNQWYYVKSTEFDVTKFFKDEMKDSVTGKTILHNTCGYKKTEGDVGVYQYIIQPVFKVKEATVTMKWDDSKLQAYQELFTNGKEMKISMLDTIDYNLVSAKGSTELPSEYIGYKSNDSFSELPIGESSYVVNLSMWKINVFNHTEPPAIYIKLYGSDKETDWIEIPISQEDIQMYKYNITQPTICVNYSLPTDVFSGALESVEIKAEYNGGFVNVTGAVYRKIGNVAFQTATVSKWVDALGAHYPMKFEAKNNFSLEEVGDIPYNAVTPGKLSFSPSAAYTVLQAQTGTSSINVMYDPISSTEGKDNVDIYYNDGEGSLLEVDSENRWH